MSETDKILEYIGADKNSINQGTKVKYNILRRVIQYCIDKKSAPQNSLISGLSLCCNVTPRTMREGYIEPLIEIGILKIESSIIYYVGLTETVEPEKEITKEEMKKLEEEALK